MASEVKRAFLGLGTNQGRRETVLAEAVRRLRRIEGVTVRRVSPLFETEPVGPPDQDWYLNAVVEIELAVLADELLILLKQLEKDMGRRPSQRWGPRLIDIDILWVEGETLSMPHLTVPHPQMEERAFVLVPLATLAPDMVLASGRTVVQTLAALDDPHQVIPYVRTGSIG